MYNQQPQKISIKASDEVLAGNYANLMQIMHSKEEFVLDFISLFGQQGVLNSRVVTSPGHVKRIINALAGNLKKYEDKFGKIKEAKQPESQKEIGFQS